MNLPAEIISDIDHSSDALLVFRAGGSFFCTKAIKVVAIIEPPPLCRFPMRSPACMGVTFFRDSPVAVFCLRTYLGAPINKAGKDGVVIIAKVQNQMMGVWVDESLNIINIDKANYITPDSCFAKSYIKYFIPYNDKLLFFVDFETTLFMENLKQKSKTDFNLLRSKPDSGTKSHQGKSTLTAANNENHAQSQYYGKPVAEKTPNNVKPLSIIKPGIPRTNTQTSSDTSTHDHVAGRHKEKETGIEPNTNMTGSRHSPHEAPTRQVRTPPQSGVILKLTHGKTVTPNQQPVASVDKPLPTRPTGPAANQGLAHHKKQATKKSIDMHFANADISTTNQNDTNADNKHSKSVANEQTKYAQPRDIKSKPGHARSPAKTSALSHSARIGHNNLSTATNINFNARTDTRPPETNNALEVKPQYGPLQLQQIRATTPNHGSAKNIKFGLGFAATLLVLAIFLWQPFTLTPQTNYYSASSQQQSISSDEIPEKYKNSVPGDKQVYASTQTTPSITAFAQLPQESKSGSPLFIKHAADTGDAPNKRITTTPSPSELTEQHKILNTATIKNTPSSSINRPKPANLPQIASRNNSVPASHTKASVQPKHSEINQQQIGMILKLESEALKITVERPDKHKTAKTMLQSRYAKYKNIKGVYFRPVLLDTKPMNKTNSLQNPDNGHQLSNKTGAVNDPHLSTLDASLTREANNDQYEEYMYVVVKGDTLWDIAAKLLGDPYKYKLLSEFSHVRDPNLIYPGDIVTIRKLIQK